MNSGTPRKRSIIGFLVLLLLASGLVAYAMADLFMTFT